MGTCSVGWLSHVGVCCACFFVVSCLFITSNVEIDLPIWYLDLNVLYIVNERW
jgi:hypothetical protein